MIFNNCSVYRDTRGFLSKEDLKHLETAVVRNKVHSVVDVDLGVEIPGEELLRLEPQGELALGRLDGVGTVDDVAVKRKKKKRCQFTQNKHSFRHLQVSSVTYRSTSIPKSPRTVPGAEARGLVAPIIMREVATTPLPS